MLTIFYMEVSPLFNKHTFDRAMVYIDESRKIKVNAAKQEKSKILCLAAGLLLSYAVYLYRKNEQRMDSMISSLDLIKLLEQFEKEKGFWWDDSMKVKETPNGKPYLVHHSGLFFNLSHSGDYVVLAFSNQEVGVDIQEWRTVSDSVYKRLLHVQESNERGRESFFSLWTAKEAFVKCTGEGLRKDFRELYVDYQKGCVTDTNTGVSLSLIQLDVLPEYSVAVCTGKT